MSAWTAIDLEGWQAHWFHDAKILRNETTGEVFLIRRRRWLSKNPPRLRLYLDR